MFFKDSGLSLALLININRLLRMAGCKIGLMEQHISACFFELSPSSFLFQMLSRGTWSPADAAASVGALNLGLAPGRCQAELHASSWVMTLGFSSLLGLSCVLGSWPKGCMLLCE